MTSYSLSALAEKLDKLQDDSLTILKQEIKSTDTVFDRLQLRDMTAVIEQDISCRGSLAVVASVIPRVELSEESYTGIIKNSASILGLLRGLSIPADMQGAFETVDQAVHSPIRHSLADVFTVISVLVTAVSRCMTQLTLEQQQQTIKLLDQLLAIKEQQLTLLMQFAKWHTDFMS